MGKASKLTVNAKWLQDAAHSLETEARESLTVWVVLGQSHRYGENLGKAAVLRRAAEMKSVSERREFLRNNGVQA
jgi:hypothetical protein